MWFIKLFFISNYLVITIYNRIVNENVYKFIIITYTLYNLHRYSQCFNKIYCYCQNIYVTSSNNFTIVFRVCNSSYRCSDDNKFYWNTDSMKLSERTSLIFLSIIFNFMITTIQSQYMVINKTDVGPTVLMLNNKLLEWMYK